MNELTSLIKTTEILLRIIRWAHFESSCKYTGKEKLSVTASESVGWWHSVQPSVITQ